MKLGNVAAAKALHSAITQAKENLDLARTTGDKLNIDLAEDALNYLLDRYKSVTDVTRN